MKIVHIAANAPFNDGWGYQENLLPKYQAMQGNVVTMLTTDTAHADGKIIHVDEKKFRSVDGFDVIRFPYKHFLIKKLTTIFYKMDVYSTLLELQPDFIFFHGLLSCTFFDVIKYKKKMEKEGKHCVIVQDNHLDYNIGIKFSTVRQKFLRAYYRLFNRITQRYVAKVYGVTPWRKKYAEDYFGISAQKTDVLIMGADDQKIDFAHREEIRSTLREQYNIADDEFLIVTGGKIDSRKNIIQLLNACKEMPNTKILVFGMIFDDEKKEFYELVNKFKNIIYVGWVESDKVYDYFFAADLAVFPGQHSVLWEQACAAKVPCVFLKWEGMEHVNVGGNAMFLEDASVETIKTTIEKLHFTYFYDMMNLVASSEATDVFLYSKIAKKSVEMWGK